MGSLLWKAASTALFMQRGCGQGVSRAANLWGAEICLAWWTSHRNDAELCKEVRWGLHVWLHVWLHGLFPMQKMLRLGSPNTQDLPKSEMCEYWHGVKKVPLSGSISSCGFPSWDVQLVKSMKYPQFWKLKPETSQLRGSQLLCYNQLWLAYVTILFTYQPHDLGKTPHGPEVQ